MGVSLIAYFAPVILKGVGVTDSLNAVLSGVLTTFFFLGTIPLYWYDGSDLSLCIELSLLTPCLGP